MVPAWKVTSEPPRADGPCERRSRRWSVPFEVDTRVIRPAAMYPNDFVFASASIFPLAWGFWRSRMGPCQSHRHRASPIHQRPLATGSYLSMVSVWTEGSHARAGPT